MTNNELKNHLNTINKDLSSIIIELNNINALLAGIEESADIEEKTSDIEK